MSRIACFAEASRSRGTREHLPGRPRDGARRRAMVRRVYGHLGQVRHRAEAVEYRVE